MRSFPTITFSGHFSSAGTVDRGRCRVLKTGTGTYTVFVPPGLRLLTASGATDGGGGALGDVNVVDNHSFTVSTYLSSTGAANDWGFNYTCQVSA